MDPHRRLFTFWRFSAAATCYAFLPATIVSAVRDIAMTPSVVNWSNSWNS
ncbi:hypothetical protein ATN83_1991 [Raoultella ornithinolytica]|nr:hypothetical protein ATN83_1991 [Raoultella ornithinolytica]